jgi:hypothetical protein
MRKPKPLMSRLTNLVLAKLDDNGNVYLNDKIWFPYGVKALGKWLVKVDKYLEHKKEKRK